MLGITHRLFLLSSSFILLTLAGSAFLSRSATIGAITTDSRKPNFVFMLIDDLGWVDLGCYGSAFYKTPNLDRLAGQGMKFTDAYAACPVCSPTRASIMTGKYPARLHLTDWLPGRKDMPSQKLLRPPFLQQLPLVPLLKQTGGLKRDTLYWHYPHYSNQGGKPGGAVRQGDFKLIEFYEDNHVELYHLRQDISEKNDLAAKMPEKVVELRQKMSSWRQAVNAQMMTPNPGYQPANHGEK